jgi:endonuclease YncB( thermonuclease family)
MGAMVLSPMMSRQPRRIALAFCALLWVAASPHEGFAAKCAFEPQGEGRVSDVIDGKSLRLTDGREIKLAGIEPVSSSRAALSALVAGQDVTLRSQDDSPDRYGRQSAFVFLASSDAPVQALLLVQGAALVSAAIADRDCSSLLMAAEAEARDAKRGIWADPTVIKNAESPDDILAGIGRFAVVEGKVLSVRQAGTTTYLNFGRNFTRDFAATISKRMIPAVESAGITLKSLENRRIRIRGWVEARPGPRIEVLGAGQIEVLGGS